MKQAHLDAVTERIDAAALQDRWDLVGDETRRFLRRNHIALGKQTADIEVRFFSGFSPEEVAQVQARFAKDAREHAEAIARQPDGIAGGRESERLSGTVAHPLHSYLRETFGLRPALSAGLMADHDGHFMIGVHAPVDEPTVSAEESERFRALVMRLRRAVSVMAVVERHAAMARGLAAAFDEVAVGLILCSADGRPIHVNAAAADLVKARDALRLERGAIRLLDRSAEALVLAEIARAAGGTPGRGHPIPARRAGAAPSLIVTVAGFSPGLAALFLEDPTRALLPARERLARLAGLSRSQATVALLAARGETTAAIAARLGISENTARTHLRRAFAKLDCQDRPALALCLAALGCALR